MYLKSLKLNNFRKFSNSNDNNVIYFTDYVSDLNNISQNTTLIVGKNNSGKTTVIEALKTLVVHENIDVSDFNYNYLMELYENYIQITNKEDVERIPELSFEIIIGIDKENDLLTKLVKFISITDDIEDIVIKIKWEVEENELFKEELIKFIRDNTSDNTSDNADEEIKKIIQFSVFLNFLKTIKFKLTYLDKNDNVIDQFKLKNIMEIKTISAITVTNDNCLSKAFSKIVSYRYQKQNTANDRNIDNKINNINIDMTTFFKNNHTQGINNIVTSAISLDKYKVLLRSDLTFKTLLDNVLKYEYIENKINISENKFGLGYTNLMMIIAKIIDYMEHKPNSSFTSNINLIAIEEPETYMHPQMQELFLNTINDVITGLLYSANQTSDNTPPENTLNSQLIITTHSAHILNSKIHQSNSFKNINYITEKDKQLCSVKFDDDVVYKASSKSKPDKSLNFIKKHITFGVSELFFCDAAIFVEGLTEYTLLKYYISQHKTLNKKYISIHTISGAHAHMYDDLIQALKIPVLIITDLDIKERVNNEQISNIINRESTNPTLKYYFKSNKINEYQWIYEKNNLLLVTQKEPIEGFYATSFEEAFVLTNHDKQILNEVLTRLFPRRFGHYRNNIIHNSYKIQYMLNSKKTDFANSILLKQIDGNNLEMPSYILNGIQQLCERLGVENG